ncbi:hypothetical protein ACFYOC_03400 [Nocardiopsis alba]|uniref:hypothetical protein n=1 Tax=Nocardiopsis TaxID=2013 RepID=UPI00131A8925|nr:MULTISPECIES: hypothetical protein [Nocardiopsis]MEC3893272.1 hypothetical protein [Nocardiopsis sp. LDBS1602]
MRVNSRTLIVAALAVAFLGAAPAFASEDVPDVPAVSTTEGPEVPTPAPEVTTPATDDPTFEPEDPSVEEPSPEFPEAAPSEPIEREPSYTG